MLFVKNNGLCERNLPIPSVLALCEFFLIPQLNINLNEKAFGFERDYKKLQDETSHYIKSENSEMC